MLIKIVKINEYNRCRSLLCLFRLAHSPPPLHITGMVIFGSQLAYAPAVHSHLLQNVSIVAGSCSNFSSFQSKETSRLMRLAALCLGLTCWAFATPGGLAELAGTGTLQCQSSWGQHCLSSNIRAFWNKTHSDSAFSSETWWMGNEAHTLTW